MEHMNTVGSQTQAYNPADAAGVTSIASAINWLYAQPIGANAGQSFMITAHLNSGTTIDFYRTSDHTVNVITSMRPQPSVVTTIKGRLTREHIIERVTAAALSVEDGDEERMLLLSDPHDDDEEVEISWSDLTDQ